MNTNLFERPIAANPISQFSALPLQFINQLNQQKEQKEARMYAMEDEISKSLMGTHALPGDAKRHQEIISGLEEKLDTIASSPGDYSEIEGKLRSIKREVGTSMRTGELGSINSNYGIGVKNREEQLKNYRAEKSNKAGMTMSLQSTANHVTTKNEFGQWSTLRPYQPTTIVDFQKELTSSVKDIHEQYDENGDGLKSDDMIIEHLQAKLTARPELESAIKENFNVMYTPQEGLTKQQSYDIYKSKTLATVVGEQSYQKLSGTGISGGNTGGLVIDGFALDTGSASSMKGGTFPWLREGVSDVFGVDSTKEFDDWKSSNKGSFEIKHMQNKTNTKMPEDHSEAVAWYEKHKTNSKTTSISTTRIPPNLKYSIINKKGFFSVQSRITRRDGSVVDADFVKKNIEGEIKGGRTAEMFSIADKGSGAYGKYLITGKDGEQYLMEPRDLKTLTDPTYVHNKIMDVQSDANMTGRKEIQLRVDLKVQGGKVPRGNYEVRNILAGEKSQGGVQLLQDGKVKFVTRGQKDGSGNLIYKKV